ncbi:ABC transporter substrate-binding protein [Lentzea tibetensis]|uniref:ABC transporter substrate-binding protein n=1 Tax=Lentzea tibetensis TaxID=2591470 RepID=UPI00164581A0|nr:ABC transporter substrate-binding protein [Lentzea tibetensis]
MIGRRLVLTAPLALAACGVTTGGPVRVAVTWSGWELGRFRLVLKAFEREYGVSTEVVGLGDDISAVLGSRRGGAVDVVMLPQIWAVHGLGDRLAPLDRFVPPSRFPLAWRNILTHEGAVRGIPFKVAHKSVVWYRKDLFERRGEQPPRTWSDWIGLNRRLADSGTAPLALAGADGWVLSDFFENVLYGLDQDTYLSLADKTENAWRSSQVVDAFREVGRMWSPQGALSGEAGGALLTQAESAVVDHFLTGRAAMVAGADFTYPVIQRHRGADLTGRWLDWFRFPAPNNRTRSPKVGGDVVVVPAPASDGALALAEWLATAEAQRIWASQGGLLSVHTEISRTGNTYPTTRIADLAREVTAEPIGRLVFDLADQLGPVGVGLRRVLQDFLRAVGGNESRVEAEAAAAAARMERLAARSGS